MILEYAQLLSTAHHILDGPNVIDGLYKKTHVNHPCAIWVRDSKCNYFELYELFLCLCDEYSFRFNKTHKTDTTLTNLLKIPPKNISNCIGTSKPLCMPESYKNSKSVVWSYRNYYTHGKSHLVMKWTNRETPWWLELEKEMFDV